MIAFWISRDEPWEKGVTADSENKKKSINCLKL